MISLADPITSAQPTRARLVENRDRALTSRQEALHDIGLVRRFVAGDEAAFDEIIARYRERLFAVAFAVLKNHADAEEIAQDAFVRAYRGLATFRGDSSLATWLHRIALNLARNRYWYFFRRRRHATVSLDGVFSETSNATFSEMVATPAAGPAREAMVHEFSSFVTTCMARLSAPHYEILTLRNSQNRSYGEIAERLGISVGTVKSRMARARENLRVLLTEACPEFGPDALPVEWFDPACPTDRAGVFCA